VSLLEILITLALIGVVLSFAMSSLRRDSPGTLVRRTAQEVATEIAAARAFARHSGQNVRIQFYTDGLTAARWAVGTTAYGDTNISVLRLALTDSLATGTRGTKLPATVTFGRTAADGPLGLAAPIALTGLPGDSLLCRPDGTCSAPAGDGAAIYLSAPGAGFDWAITVNFWGRVRLWNRNGGWN
jgi:Tfp pilus assembly protein FimT